jgi:hypothetical protein
MPRNFCQRILRELIEFGKGESRQWHCPVNSNRAVSSKYYAAF